MGLIVGQPSTPLYIGRGREILRKYNVVFTFLKCPPDTYAARNSCSHMHALATMTNSPPKDSPTSSPVSVQSGSKSPLNTTTMDAPTTTPFWTLESALSQEDSISSTTSESTHDSTPSNLDLPISGAYGTTSAKREASWKPTVLRRPSMKRVRTQEPASTGGETSWMKRQTATTSKRWSNNTSPRSGFSARTTSMSTPATSTTGRRFTSLNGPGTPTPCPPKWTTGLAEYWARYVPARSREPPLFYLMCEF